MKNEPLVSVIIPTYNRPHFLPRAIRSVLNQTYQNFELIIVDDGSQPPVKDAVDNFKDKRIRYIYQRNRGLPAARNNGIHKAKGDFITFIDDDEMLATNLSERIKCMMSDPDIGFCYTSAWFQDDDDAKIESLYITLSLSKNS